MLDNNPSICVVKAIRIATTLEEHTEPANELPIITILGNQYFELSHNLSLDLDESNRRIKELDQIVYKTYNPAL